MAHAGEDHAAWGGVGSWGYLVKWSQRSIVSLAAALVLLPGLTQSAQAAAPVNDDVADATVIDVLPTTITQDTSEATTAAGDEVALAACSRTGSVSHTVWFTYTPTEDGSLTISSPGPADVHLLVFRGDPAQKDVVHCQVNFNAFQVVAGQQYYVMAFAAGVEFSLSFTDADPPALDFTVDPQGVLGKKGAVTITGTYSCTVQPATLRGSLAQTGTRRTADASFEIAANECDGASHSWSLTLTSYLDRYSTGATEVTVRGYRCDWWQCQVAGPLNQRVDIVRHLGKR